MPPRPFASPVEPTVPGRLHPLGLVDYRIDPEGFWGVQQALGRDAVIPHCDAALERVGWTHNFRAAAAGTLATERVGRLFTDSEIYKTMEAMAWENLREPSDAFARRLAEFTDLVAGAQHDDGYLNTYYGYEGGPDRYTDMEWGHELYCAGHLIQAAVAVSRSGGPQAFVDLALRVADHVVAEFGERGRQTLDGHPEIETALVELYRLTGDRRYLDQAKLFVDRRGHRTLDDTMFRGRDYYQDGVPVRDAEVLVGHAVRALYLAAGAIDVAVETGDDELLDAVRRQYDRTLERRTYLTGGMGSNHHGETYGDDFELPSERAYAETCAAVASVHVAWRLLIATGDQRYADVIERTLYNSVVSSPSVDGRTFFYVNALQRRAPGIEPEPGVPSLRRTDGMRADWFTTSCCPTNLARTFASLSAYLATIDASGVQLHQYAAGRLTASLDGGVRVALSVHTAYPNDGAIRVRIDEGSDEGEWTLTLRVPGWARRATLDEGDGPREVRPGTVAVTRDWRVGDEVVLALDTTPRFVHPDPRIDDVRGCVAVERGPLVYAIESVDQPDLDLGLVEIRADDAPADASEPVGIDGIVPVAAAGVVREAPHAAWPYGAEPAEGGTRPVRLTLIPYFRWANRGSSTMRVWTPTVRTSTNPGSDAA